MPKKSVSLPHDLAAERAVLGAILITPEILPSVAEAVKDAEFYFERHRRIYGRMVALTSEGHPVDIVTLASSFSREGALEEVGGMTYLSSLTDATTVTTSAPAHAGIVHAHAVTREMIRQTEEMSQRLRDGDISPDDAATRLASLGVSTLDVKRGGLRHIGDGLQSAFDHLEKSAEHLGMTGLTTGLTRLDYMLGGLQKKDLVIIAARPSMGKTALLGSMALAASGAAGAVVVFSLEMSQTQIVSRLLTSRAEIPWRQRIASNAVTERDWQGLGHAAEDLYRRDIYIDDTPAITLDYLRAQVAKLARTTQLGVIFVDYLQLMTGRGTSREQEVSGISRGLKQIAKEFNVPLVALSQLSRKCEERSDKRPIMSDLRESGAVEQDADVILAIYRDIVYKRIADPRGVFSDEQARSAELIVLKHRNGPTGTAIVAYDEGTTTFRDAPREWG